MGRRLGDLIGVVDIALISPSERTRQTWQLVRPGLGTVHEERTDDRIYRAWGDELVRVLADLPGGAGTVLLLGHEPGVSGLTLLLDDHRNPDLRDRVAVKFPTCAVAILEVATPWAGLAPGGASLTEFFTPRDVR